MTRLVEAEEEDEEAPCERACARLLDVDPRRSCVSAVVVTGAACTPHMHTRTRARAKAEGRSASQTLSNKDSQRVGLGLGVSERESWCKAAALTWPSPRASTHSTHSPSIAGSTTVRRVVGEGSVGRAMPCTGKLLRGPREATPPPPYAPRGPLPLSRALEDGPATELMPADSARATEAAAPCACDVSVCHSAAAPGTRATSIRRARGGGRRTGGFRAGGLRRGLLRAVCRLAATSGEGCGNTQYDAS